MDRNILRLLDANLNRAVEGMRVLEEAARMLRNNGALAGEFKDLRHELTGVVRDSADLNARMLFARDVEHDVLREVESESERSRIDIIDVIRANAGRAQEGVRCLEEYIKLERPDLSAGFKAVRFKLYELEKKLAQLFRTVDRLSVFRLGVLFIVDFARDSEEDVGALAQTAVEAGAGMVIYRDGSSDNSDLFRNSGMSVAACRDHDAACLIYGRLDAALLTGADGVLINGAGISAMRFRECAGSEFIIGIAVDPGSFDMIDEKTAAGADFILAGPLNGTSESWESLEKLVSRFDLPVTAVGCFKQENSGRLFDAGVVGVGIPARGRGLAELADEIAAWRKKFS